MRSIRNTSAPRSPSRAPAHGVGAVPPIPTTRKPSNGPVTMKSPLSAMEPDGVIEWRATNARRVGLDVAVLIAKRNAEQQLVILGNAELQADDFGKQSERALRTGRDAARGQRQHQGLRRPPAYRTAPA